MLSAWPQSSRKALLMMKHLKCPASSPALPALPAPRSRKLRSAWGVLQCPGRWHAIPTTAMGTCMQLGLWRKTVPLTVFGSASPERWSREHWLVISDASVLGSRDGLPILDEVRVTIPTISLVRRDIFKVNGRTKQSMKGRKKAAPKIIWIWLAPWKATYSRSINIHAGLVRALLVLESGIDKDVLKLIAGAKTFVPNFELPTTLNYYHIAAWKPQSLMPFVYPTPVMFVTPENDLVSLAGNQKSLIFDRLQHPKRQLLVPEKGHMDILNGSDFDGIVDA